MFHVEIRSGIQVVREFNLTDERLWLEFLAPLVADREFSVADHDFIPRQARLKVYEGAELRPDQLGMGRGWQNVERTAIDVTERVLTRAREHMAGPGAQPQTASGPPQAAPPSTEPARPPAQTEPAAPVPVGTVDLLRERLIGRLSAGPIGAQELLAITAELVPERGEPERLEVVRRAVWALLERDVAQLAPSGR